MLVAVPSGWTFKTSLARTVHPRGRWRSPMANERLRQAVLNSGLSVDDLADHVGTDAKTVERWITQGRVPHPRNRVSTAQALGIDELALWPELADSRARG